MTPHNPTAMRRKTYLQVEDDIFKILSQEYPFAEFDLQLYDVYAAVAETKTQAGGELWMFHTVRLNEVSDASAVQGGIHYEIMYGSRQIRRSQILNAAGEAKAFSKAFLIETARKPTLARRVIAAAVAVTALVVSVSAIPFIVIVAAICHSSQWLRTKLSSAKFRIRS